MAENKEKWVTVYKAWGEAESNTIKELLESNSIFCYISGIGATSAKSFTRGGLGEIQIKVTSGDVAKAEAIIAKNED